jgi:hypothetical protein
VPPNLRSYIPRREKKKWREKERNRMEVDRLERIRIERSGLGARWRRTSR